MARVSGISKVKLSVLILLVAGLFIACSQIPEYPVEEPIAARVQSYDYQRDIRPIFEHKCMACHGCYDAPCQLKLTSAEGLERGASILPVYDGARLEDMLPTRLGVDANSTAEWREKGFFSVLHGAEDGQLSGLDASVLYKMIELGHSQPVTPNSRLPASISLGTARTNSCPSIDRFAEYADDFPHGGMPYGATGLSDEEFTRLTQWISEGAVVTPALYTPGEAEQAMTTKWEQFLNQTGKREQLVARYLFEHLFAAHLYFPDIDGSHFYELVRSSTPPGQPVRALRTVRPNDDPEGPYFYRLQPLRQAIVEKTHIVYALGDTRMQRFKSLFLQPDWDVVNLPDYSYEARANPFVTFAAIPAKARYQFLLDDAEYFVRNFIRGPVCRGQIATDVIRDQFWTVFEDPEQEAYVNDAEYRAQASPLLGLPGQKSDLLALGPEWLEYNEKRNDYLKLRGQYYAERKPDGATADELWDGDNWNRDALLTIFRHYDSASVRRGLHGRVPRTIWVMDYPLLERTYYELVANFNVFGSVSHQGQTRLYFDLIRNGAEHNMLRFVPAKQREPLYAHWYQGSAKIKHALTYTGLDTTTPVAMNYTGAEGNDAVMQRFSQLLMDRTAAVSGPPDTLNRCPQNNCQRASISAAQQQVEATLQPLARANGASLPVISLLPEVTFLRVTQGEQRWVYTLVHNRAHSSVAFMFGEQSRLLPKEDTLTLIEGTLGSYPNFSFNVPLEELPSFVDSLSAIQQQAGLHSLADRWGVRRTHPQFWDIMADFKRSTEESTPEQAGILDVNRYENL
ncbi:Fatty acid cis/trans isomerase (CTI) [Halopseudomonas sabulinigri]|uniref:Fatty acid cis/trans isomerase (CTI) n=1 Tax=Halopseudomonas sabulinigri TaxID=472181 RepID=A0A1H1NQ46_9GAMM|nr:fatty acid cis/trans isomerase [Halopseudomonas sabulinigri]SDS01111.1 Fatty acid cis/trans isomerase (CTI) [Halopseudomonas sabulinigri]